MRRLGLAVAASAQAVGAQAVAAQAVTAPAGSQEAAAADFVAAFNAADAARFDAFWSEDATLFWPGAAAPEPAPAAPQHQFMERLRAHCGKAYEGRLVTTDAADAAMAGQRMVMHVASCTPDAVRIPFHVGSDRSRTWVITRTPAGLRLKHDHRHEDGSADELTNYGGDSEGSGTSGRQEFPADAESVALFRRTGREVSAANVWAVEVTGAMFAYELRRPAGPGQRFFRVEFDLTRPVPPPPLPSGWQP